MQTIHFKESAASLNDQMYALRFLSNHAGLQDASTWIRRWVEDRRITNGELCRDFYPYVEQAEQAQYGATQQLTEVVAMARRFGLTKAADHLHGLLSPQR